jgi:hypothetical protein
MQARPSAIQAGDSAEHSAAPLSHRISEGRPLVVDAVRKAGLKAKGPKKERGKKKIYK